MIKTVFSQRNLKHEWKAYLTVLQSIKEKTFWKVFLADFLFYPVMMLGAFIAQFPLTGLQPIQADLQPSLSALATAAFISIVYLIFLLGTWSFSKYFMWKSLAQKALKLRSFFKFTLVVLIWNFVLGLPALKVFEKLTGLYYQPFVTISSKLIGYTYIFVLILVLAALVFLYIHFMYASYYTLARTDKLKSAITVLKPAALQLKHFVLPGVYLALSFLVLAIVFSFLDKIAPTTFLNVVFTPFLFAWLTYYKVYYSKKLSEVVHSA
jgi:hypothetical protein